MLGRFRSIPPFQHLPVPWTPSVRQPQDAADALDLSVRLAVGNLFHGALSDSFGRLRPSSPVLRTPGRHLRAFRANRDAGVFPRAAGHVDRSRNRRLASRHPRRVFPPTPSVSCPIRRSMPASCRQSRRGWAAFSRYAGWHSMSWLPVVVGVSLRLANRRLLPKTLHRSQRQPCNA